mgnify:CR=1 FL=1
MKIVHFIMSLQTGGSETMLVDIINDQVSTNNLSLIIFNDQINITNLSKIDRRVTIYRLNRKEKSRNIIPVIKLNLLLLRIWPDAIHCHHVSAARIILIKRNLVFTAHSTNISDKIIKTYKRVFAISETVKDDLYKSHNIRAKVIYNGIDFDKIPIKRNYDFGVFKIVQVSRLDHEIKGQHILIKALNILINELGILNVCIDFIGEGPSYQYILELVMNYRLQKKVKFLGLKDRNYIYNHLQEYNLLVQPSLSEGFGLTVIEAMAAKLPVLVSDKEGPSEIVKNGKYGWLFKHADIKDCSAQIQRIIKEYDSQDFKKVIQEAYEYGRKNFSIKNTTAQYLKEYIL